MKLEWSSFERVLASLDETTFLLSRLQERIDV